MQTYSEEEVLAIAQEEVDRNPYTPLWDFAFRLARRFIGSAKPEKQTVSHEGTESEACHTITHFREVIEERP